MSEARPRIAVVTFPGSNDDRDAAWALGALGAEAVPVWHAEPELPAVAAVVLPGGFSYSTGGVGRRGPVTLRHRDLERLRDALVEHPELAEAIAMT